MKRYIIGAVILFFSGYVSAQNETKDTAYVRVIHERVAKIVDKLNVRPVSKSVKIKEIMAQQYFDLNKIDTRRDEALKAIKSAQSDKAVARDSVEAIRSRSDNQIASLHAQYIKRLSSLLTPEQVDGVKNGMTYNVLNVTYKAYTQMLPDLTAAQKKQIMDWLVEAREHAMDGGSSKEKHAWFGKYKGRINNYLAKQGIDMKQAEKDWLEREKASKIEKVSK